MSNETPAAIDADMFEAVFNQNWDNARYFPIFYTMTTAGFITLIVYRLVTGEAMK